MMRWDETAVQAGKETQWVLPPECVCGAGKDASSRLAQPAVVPTCPGCGGSLLRAADAVRPGRQDRRHLQDFLSAFV